ncbi:MAG: bifunctional hydroxymethylpyrimidine kinase/phosphomethylpyrimidine kinase [Verrucomicrobiota bacterium JB025]|nr:bifunctional hydroxymethylpyrimidine kinase/phosphomethylpyrimidine kinase [Verrucomicrobiota bacterium JB025]
MHIPASLTIAGSDCSAGAGLQADLKTFQHFRTYGLTAATCVVSETAHIVRLVHPVPVDVVIDQISLLLDSFPVAAAKTGMLFSAAHVRATAALLAENPDLPLVVDPVMVSSTGDPLLQQDAIAAYRETLLPLATVITPNLPEAEVLLDRKIATAADLEPAARELAATFHTAVLLKGGHLDQAECLDLLVAGGEIHHFATPRIATPASHGTGCTLSAAIAANLAHGKPLAEAVAIAKDYINRALRESLTFAAADYPTIHALNQGTTL